MSDLVCIIPGPTKELRREPAGDRWCFGCSKRLPHFDVALVDEELSYYDPVWITQCLGCGRDRTTFPERVW